MKKLTIIFLAFAAIGAFYACSDDDALEFIAQPDPEGIQFISSLSSEYVITQATASNLAERFVWKPLNLDAPTNITYALQGSITDDFAEIVDYGTTQTTEIGITIGQLLSLATAAGLDNDPATVDPVTEEPNNTGTLYFRIRGYAGTGEANAVEQFSETLALNVVLPEQMEEEEPMPAMLAVPGDHQGWNPSPDAVAYVPFLAASTPDGVDFEGFVQLNNEFKFVGPDDSGVFQWGNIDWGDASGVNGSYTQVLTADGEGNCGTASADGPGYYWVKANTEDLTYSITLTNWGVIGNATPTGWDSDTDMVYDDATKTWSVTLDLIAQQAPDNGLKFRANDGWDINLGDNDADGSLDFSGTNISIAEDGNYTIVLDLSNPRAYTYSITKN
jgi:hypothetical protein